MEDRAVEPLAEREKWSAKQKFKTRELDLEERRTTIAQAEFDLKVRDHSHSGWKNPVVVAILAAAVAGGGNAVVAYTNGSLQRDLEVTKAEHARMLEMVKTGDADKAAENLRFLADSGLITDPGVLINLRAFLASRKQGSGPTLPAPTPTTGGADGARRIQDIESSDPLHAAARKVGQLLAFNKREQVSKCTAFLVDVDVVLTAGYCVQFQDRQVTSYVFEIGAGALRSRFPVIGAPIALQNGGLDGKDRQPNYALVRVSGTPGETFGFLALSASPPRPADQLASVLYRAGAQQLVAFDSNCKVVTVSDAQFTHQCAGGGGSAGAPVLLRDGSSVVGLQAFNVVGGFNIAIRADVIASALQESKAQRR